MSFVQIKTLHESGDQNKSMSRVIKDVQYGDLYFSHSNNSILNLENQRNCYSWKRPIDCLMTANCLLHHWVRDNSGKQTLAQPSKETEGELV